MFQARYSGLRFESGVVHFLVYLGNSFRCFRFISTLHFIFSDFLGCFPRQITWRGKAVDAIVVTWCHSHVDLPRDPFCLVALKCCPCSPLTTNAYLPPFRPLLDVQTHRISGSFSNNSLVIMRLRSILPLAAVFSSKIPAVFSWGAAGASRIYSTQISHLYIPQKAMKL